MKKTAITLLACAALGAAYGQEEQQKSGFGLELNAAYNFALKDIVKAEDGVPAYSVDTYGVDLTAVYAFNKHHAVNIRFGYTTGDDEHTLYGYSYDDEFVSESSVVSMWVLLGQRARSKTITWEELTLRARASGVSHGAQRLVCHSE